MDNLFDRFATWIISKISQRAPDFIIGGKEDPYIRRWWVIPRNRFFNIYLHEILRPDDDRALHDHPWWNLSLILRGCYEEMTPKGTFRRNKGGAYLPNWLSTSPAYVA